MPNELITFSTMGGETYLIVFIYKKKAAGTLHSQEEHDIGSQEKTPISLTQLKQKSFPEFEF